MIRLIVMLAIVDAAMTGFALWLTIDAGGDAVPVAAAGAVAGLLAGRALAPKALARYGGGDGTGAYGPILVVMAAVVAARVLGVYVQVALAWFVAVTASSAVLALMGRVRPGGS